MARCAGLFVIEKDSRGKWHPEIRLSIPLLRRRDWPWPQQVCGMNGHAPEEVQLRINLAKTLVVTTLMTGIPESGEKDESHRIVLAASG